MNILVDINKQLWSGRRVFSLEVSFASDKDVVVLFGPSGAGKSLHRITKFELCCRSFGGNKSD